MTTNRTQYKSSWKWPIIAEDTIVIGGANVNRVTSSPLKDIQIECYPGTHFQNLTSMLKAQNKYKKIPKNIIVNVGINDRNSRADAAATKNLTTMANKIATKYPSSDIYFTQINYSDKLTTMEKTNLDAINKTM